MHEYAIFNYIDKINTYSFHVVIAEFRHSADARLANISKVEKHVNSSGGHYEASVNPCNAPPYLENQEQVIIH